jgi:hypothetical protein
VLRKFQIVIATGIAIVLPILVSFGVNLFQPYPHFEQHTAVTVRITPTTPEEWKAWEEENVADKRREREQRDAIDQATRPFSRLLILVATPIGIAAILVGSYLKIASVGTGLIFGGALTLVNGYSGYWAHLDNGLRLASILAGLCLVGLVLYRQSNAARNPPT